MTDRFATSIALLVTSILLVLPVRAQPGGLPSDVEQAAHTGAQEWLELVDEGDYEESWEEASPIFRDRIDAEAWEKNSATMADSIGTPVRRTLATIQYRDSLRTVDATGPFVLLTYRTRFTDGHFEELLVLVEGEDEWLVAGYQVSPLRAQDPPTPVGTQDGSRR